MPFRCFCQPSEYRRYRVLPFSRKGHGFSVFPAGNSRHQTLLLDELKIPPTLRLDPPDECVAHTMRDLGVDDISLDLRFVDNCFTFLLSHAGLALKARLICAQD